ncbi:MAG: hypothetical protein K2I06_08640 [Ruminococcus sp.]|nr:hypothetical protein [Ruminococcus sp.]
MNNAQIAQNIKDECKTKKVSVSKLLEDCVIRKGFIYDLEKRDYTPSVEIMGKIADYLDVSVDYLLGRTDTPTAYNTSISNVKTTVNSPQVSGNNNTIADRTKEISAEDAELLELIKKLPLKKRVKFISALYDELEEA